MVHTHDGKVVAAVVGSCVPMPVVDAIDFVLRPRQRVAYPARQRPAVLMTTQFYAVGPSLASEDKSLNLNFGVEGLAVAIVVDVAYVLEIGLC